MSEEPHKTATNLLRDTVRTKTTEASLVTEQLSKRQNHKGLLALLKPDISLENLGPKKL